MLPVCDKARIKLIIKATITEAFSLELLVYTARKRYPVWEGYLLEEQMDRLLSVSQAARMVGVPRRLLQQHIQEGHLSAFEGHIRLSELHKAYPDASSDKSGMVEKVARIREAALYKANRDSKPDVDHLSSELQRARVEIDRLYDELTSYRELAAETEQRLLTLQEKCDERQALLLGTLVGWFMNQVKLRESK